MAGEGGKGERSRLEQQLAMAQAITHIGSWEWDVGTNVVSWSDELYRIYGLEPQSVPITFETFLARVHPDDRVRTTTEVRAAIQRGGRFAYPERILRPDGSIRALETIGEVELDATGKAARLVGTCRDVTEALQAQRLAAAEQAIFEGIADGLPLGECLARICLMIEEQCAGTLASILLLDEAGEHVMHGAGPSLPDEYNRLVDGARIGPKNGSCGTAAFRREPVYVVDIETDPLWEDWRAAARPHGLRACWSSPFLARDGRVLGTFALYYRDPRAPGGADLRLISRATHVARIAVENRQLEAQLRELSAHLESIREEERAGIAREIHDQLGQGLTALKLDLAALARRAVKGSAVPASLVVERMKGLADATDVILEQVRRISAELRPGVLDDLGLAAAIEWQAEEFQRRTGTPCRVSTADVGEGRWDRDVSTAVFRVFQEALTNVARHAQAKHVEVHLSSDRGCIALLVRDDGRGITPDAVASMRSLGLLGIRERARRLGGTVEIEGVAGKGTTLSLRVPLVRSEPRRAVAS